jgi:hexosaminidase
MSFFMLLHFPKLRWNRTGRKLKKGMAVVVLLGLPAAGLAEEVSTPAIIPEPQKMELRGGGFQLTRSTRIYTDAASRGVAEYLAGRLRPATAFPLTVERAKGKTSPNGIWLTINNVDTNLGPEGYTLEVSSNSVVIRAPAAAGLFYGAQTLRQLLPAEIFATKPVRDVAWTLPGVQIEDRPRFAWRGLMLDVSRHFFSKAEVEQLLDEMALLKLNTFHWHLVDDQGWRVEIKKYPQLTRSGAWRTGIGFGLDPKASTAYGPDGRYGGFYTQADIREVVAYAQARFITIVPEIEMPGHSLAALKVFPELSCAGEGFDTNTTHRPRTGVYCAGREETFVFLQNVLAEIMDLFPGKYIHVGGDEVPMDNWRQCSLCQARMKAEGLANVYELQSYFIRRIEKFINGRDRVLIGWSDIRKGGLAPNAALMDWNGGAAEAASAGHDVVMAPRDYCYFDYYQSQDHSTEPRAIGDFLPLAKVYAFEPIPAHLASQFQLHIIGAEGVVWTEYIPNLKQVEFMAFPRLIALAEVVWSPKAARDFDDFTRRLRGENRRFELAGVNYRRATSAQVGDWTPAQINSDGVTLEWDVTKNVDAAGPWHVTFDPVSGTDGIDIAWAALFENGREISRDEHVGYSGNQPRDPSNPSDPVYTLNVPTPKPGAHYTLRARLAGSGGTNSQGEVRWSLKPAL